MSLSSALNGIFTVQHADPPGSRGVIVRRQELSMDNCRLRVRIGDVEFEAEGSREAVEAQFQAIRPYFPAVSAVPDLSSQDLAQITPHQTRPAPHSALEDEFRGILKISDRVVSVNAAPLDAGDAALLVLYGQRLARKNEAVTGNEFVRGLTSTGVVIGRSDRLFESLARRGDIMISGRHRAKRYRLTNAGLIKARARAAVLLGVPA
jgi:hypothetical protein